MKALSSMIAELICGLITILWFGCSFPYSNYRLYQQYRGVEKQLTTLSPCNFERLTEEYHHSPRILCRLLEASFAQNILTTQANNLCDHLISQSSQYTLSQRLDLLATIEKWKSFDSKYEPWIIEQGLFYLPSDLYFLSRKYLLHYEQSSLTELTPYEREKALTFLENMLRSEERSS